MGLGLALLIIALIFFCIVSPGFRKVVLIGSAVTVVGAVVLIVALMNRSEPKTNAPQLQPVAALQPVTDTPAVARASDLEVKDLRVGPAYNEYGGYRFRTKGFEVTARIKNTADFDAPRIAGQLVALDCITANKCEVTGRVYVSPTFLQIPAHEIRKLTAHVDLDSVAPAQHTRRWQLELYEPR